MFGIHIKYHKVSSVSHYGPAYLRLQWSHATHASIDEEIIIHPTVSTSNVDALQMACLPAPGHCSRVACSDIHACCINRAHVSPSILQDITASPVLHVMCIIVNL